MQALTIRHTSDVQLLDLRDEIDKKQLGLGLVGVVTGLAAYCFTSVPLCRLIDRSLMTPAAKVLSGTTVLLAAAGLGLTVGILFFQKVVLPLRDPAIVLLCQKLYSTFKSEAIRGSLLKDLCLLKSSTAFKIQLLNSMNFQQLNEARDALGDQAFKALLPHLDSKNPGVQVWQHLVEISAANPQQIKNQFLPRLSARSGESYYRPFMYLLQRELVSVGKFDSVKSEFLSAAPFVEFATLQTNYANLQTTRGVTEAINNQFKGDKNFIGSAAEFDSFNRISAIIENRANTLPQKSEEAWFKDWYADLEFANKKMTPEVLLLVSNAIFRVNLSDSLETLVSIVQGLRSIGGTNNLKDFQQRLIQKCSQVNHVGDLHICAKLTDSDELMGRVAHSLVYGGVGVTQPKTLVIAYEILREGDPLNKYLEQIELLLRREADQHWKAEIAKFEYKYSDSKAKTMISRLKAAMKK